jgi:hypothetical protein
MVAVETFASNLMNKAQQLRGRIMRNTREDTRDRSLQAVRERFDVVRRR